MSQVFDILYSIVSCYPVILIIFGTVANSLSFYICVKLAKSNNTFVFLAITAIVDTFTLFVWNLNHFIGLFFNLSTLSGSVWNCKFGEFVQYTSLQISSWILVCIFLIKIINISKYISA